MPQAAATAPTLERRLGAARRGGNRRLQRHRRRHPVHLAAGRRGGAASGVVPAGVAGRRGAGFRRGAGLRRTGGGPAARPAASTSTCTPPSAASPRFSPAGRRSSPASRAPSPPTRSSWRCTCRASFRCSGSDVALLSHPARPDHDDDLAADDHRGRVGVGAVVDPPARRRSRPAGGQRPGQPEDLGAAAVHRRRLRLRHRLAGQSLDAGGRRRRPARGCSRWCRCCSPMPAGMPRRTSPRRSATPAATCRGPWRSARWR